MARISAAIPLSAHAELAKIGVAFLRRQVDEIALELRADDDGFAVEMRLHVLADLHDVGIGLGGREIGFLDVAREDRRLVGEQEERTRERAILGRQRHRERRLAGVERRLERRQHDFFRRRALVAALDVLGDAFAPPLHAVEIGEDELGVDDLDVAHRVDGVRDVVHVGIVEAARDLDDGVDLAHVREELVAQALALTGALDEAGDVDELDRRRDDDVGAGNLPQHFEPRVRHRHHADVRVDGAERIVGRFRLAAAGDGVEQRRFADVGETDDTSSQHVWPATACVNT